MERESMNYDVVIVGAGPAGLSAAIRLKQLNPDLGVCVLEKGAEVGAHILSGCVFEPRALNELLPNWKTDNFPITLEAKSDAFYYLSAKSAYRLPTPRTMHNKGNLIISLGLLCQKLAGVAESLGVEIYPGFAAQCPIFDDNNQLTGVITGDMGIGKNGEKTPQYQPGMALLGKITLLAEGCRGSLSKQLIKHYKLDKDASPQSYGIGFKEIWQVEKSSPGDIIHTLGWPLDRKTYGGSFIYHLEKNQIALGFVIGLDYQNPWLSPFHEFQRFKTHPFVKPLLKNGERISYGARALNEGGLQAIPKLTFPGGALIGDAAGFLNVAKIKGTHTAMKSGMLAAESTHHFFQKEKHVELTGYTYSLKKSWVYKELYHVRNIRPAFHFGLLRGLIYSGIDQYILRGKAPWTFTYQPDYKQLLQKQKANPIHYDKPDNTITFDKTSSVYLSGVFHEENQPPHLILEDPKKAIEKNYTLFASPETRYCPAGVYEIVENDNNPPRLQINAQNCIHCKTCDIKDPYQNINWVPPEGGGGPNYAAM
jgi:electron-transferring-flavoprotein dehydrogenase